MWRPGRRPFVWIYPAFLLVQTFLIYSRQETKSIISQERAPGSRHVLQSDTIKVEEECIPASIQEFPEDFFTQAERAQGGVIIHVLISLYVFATLAIVCDDYFVPSLEVISESKPKLIKYQELQLPTDVAGATFMAIGTSSPELFSSLIGSFITEGDIGIGTIVGSAVFNILGVTTFAGLAVWGKNVSIDWYPVTRDSSIYAITVVALILVIQDNLVKWWESLILLVMFVCYITIMYFNQRIEKYCLNKMSAFQKWRRNRRNGEKKPLIETSSESGPLIPASRGRAESDIVHETVMRMDKEEENEGDSLWVMPVDSSLKQIWWVLTWPSAFLLHFTIPDCRKPKVRSLYPLTFIMSVLWIAILSYLSAWMVTIIAYTLHIPDTVAGITILAIGISVPEVISSIIIVRSGLGNMAICNCIGSNIFDILFCLALPWLIKALAFSPDKVVVINSSALTYTTATLLSTLVLLYLTFLFSDWNLNGRVGLTCLGLYCAFLVLACMYEMNVFGDFNPPQCPRTD